MAKFSFEEKLAGADEHLEKLRMELRQWIKSRPYAITDELDPKSGDNVVYAQMFAPTPSTILTLTGDCLYNFRSSLDHLVHAIAVSHQKRPLTDAESIDTAFPIFKDPTGFKQRGPRRIKYLSPSAQTVIERLQPYNTTNAMAHPLWLLNQLNNIDKHRRLLVTVLTPMGAGTFVPHGARRDFFEWGDEPLLLSENKTVVARYRCFSSDSSRRVKMKFFPTMIVAFGDAPAEGRFVEVVLQLIGDSIARFVIPALRKYL